MVAHVPFSIYTLLTYHSTSFGILIFENEEKKKIIRSFVHQNSSLGAKIAHSSTKKVIKILSSQTKTTIINRKSIYCFKRLLEFHSRYQYPNNANESSPRITLKPSPKIQNLPLPSFPSKEKKKEHTRPPTVWSIRIRLRIEISVDETQPLRATTYDATTTAAAAAATTTTVAAAVAVAGGKVDREAEGEGARVHARTHARTVVRARGQTDRDKEHFRRCTGRPRSAYLLLLARRGRRTRGRVTPECPRFLLSTFPLPRSPVVSPDVCLSISLPIRAYVSLSLSLRLSFLRCSLYRSLVRPSSSSFHGLLPVPGVYALSPPLFSLPSPSFFFFFFCLLGSSIPFFPRVAPPWFANAGSISFYSFSTRWSCEPRIRWNWSTWTKEGDIHLDEGLAFQLSRAGVSNILLARSE